MKILLLPILLCIQVAVFAQTVIPFQDITTNVGQFSALSPVTELGLNIDASTTTTTTFPYAPGTQFADDIGYVCQSGTSTGTLTFIFASPTEVSQIMVWNSYFDFELDHSIQNAQVVFKDNMGATITTESITAPQAIAANLLPYVHDFPSTISGVKEIDLVVTSLWGGNEISMRRVAFAGMQCTATANSITASECFSYTVPSGDETYTMSGVYMDTIPNAAGCDSVLTIDVAINSVDPSATQLNATMTAAAAGATYQWIDCDNNNDPIQGETGQSFTATVNGNYAVIVDNGCVDTSACMLVDMIGIEQLATSSFVVYPNPATNSVTIPLSNIKEVKMIDLTGRVIETNLANQGEYSKLSWGHIESSVYLIQISTTEGDFSTRIQVVSAL